MNSRQWSFSPLHLRRKRSVWYDDISQSFSVSLLDDSCVSIRSGNFLSLSPSTQLEHVMYAPSLNAVFFLSTKLKKKTWLHCDMYVWCASARPCFEDVDWQRHAMWWLALLRGMWQIFSQGQHWGIITIWHQHLGHASHRRLNLLSKILNVPFTNVFHFCHVSSSKTQLFTISY